MDIDYSYQYGFWHDESEAHVARMTGFWQRKLMPHLPENRGARILDVGCGRGFAVGAMRSLGYGRATGIDASAGQIAFARKRGLDAHHVPVERTLDWLRDAAAGDPFDLVTLFDVLEHVPKPSQIPLLRTLGECMTPEGRLVVQVPNALSSVAAIMRYQDWTHECLFTRESIDFVLHHAGFRMASFADAPHVDPDQRLVTLPKRALSAAAKGVFRTWRRLEVAAEHGFHALREPVAPNVVAVAVRRS